MAWAAGQPLSIEDIEVAPPRAHEVRIQIYHTGVCHTGTSFLPPLATSALLLPVAVIRRTSIDGSPLFKMRTHSLERTLKVLSLLCWVTKVLGLSSPLEKG